MALQQKSVRGVSLIEALVALAVMAFGMLSLVGVQATMRLNSDLSKQRTEATRIATEDLEGLRRFTSVPATGGQQSWDEIADYTLAAYVPPDNIGNTTYQVERRVNLATPTQKVVSVTVSWVDRTGSAQSVTVDTVLVAAAPALSGLLAVPAKPSPMNQINGRNVTIPDAAVPLNDGSGTSLFTPPGSSGVFWYFNNISGLICVGSATCAVPATLVSGSVSSDLRPLPSSEAPAGPAINLASGPGAMAVPLLTPQNIASTTPAQPQCYADAADSSRPYVNYFCAVMPASKTGWGGQLNMNSTLSNAGTVLTLGTGTPNRYKVCRYTTATPSIDNPATIANEALTDPNGDYTANFDHPKTYCLTAPNTPASCPNTRVTGRGTGNLINQNFLVIDGAATCPADDAATPLINGNTRQHQPTP